VRPARCFVAHVSVKASISGIKKCRNCEEVPEDSERDFSVYKNTRISERLTTQFRAEFFNVLNHTNFQSPLSSNVIFDSTGNLQNGVGAIVQTANDSREIHFALKFSW
jgi:hypothetical protein